jgi:Ca2+-binding RTX toxin-like protein
MQVNQGLLTSFSRFALALIGTALSFGALASTAFASLAVNTELVNNTSFAVSLQAVSGQSSCWNTDDFGDDDVVAAHSTFSYYSSIKTGSGTSCESDSENAHQHIQLEVEQPSADWTVPTSSGQDNLLSSGPDWSNLENIELFYHNTVNELVYVQNADQSGTPPYNVWYPASPVLSGASGDGLFCMGWSQVSYEGAPYDLQLTVDPAQECPATASDAADVGARAVEPSNDARATVAQSSAGVFNLLPMLQGACELTLTTTTYCSNINNNANWNLENVSSDVTSFEADDPPPTTYAWGQVDPPYLEQDNGTNTSGTLNYTFNYSEGATESSTTTTGYEIGDSVTFGSSASPINDKVSADYNFSSASTQQTGTTSQTSVSSSIATQPGGTTYLYGFQGTGTQEFNYTANLTFGDQTGNAEPLTTVAPGVLGYSPATAHPCIGYMIGGSGVSGSVMQMAAQAEANGDSAEDPNFDAYEQAFLSGMAGYNSSSSACPGFPSGFSSGAGFDGSGSMNASALGGTGVADTSWYPDLGSIVTCAYFNVVDTDPSNPDTPCTTPSDTSASDATAHRQVPGNVIMASHYEKHSRIVAQGRSVLMIGGKADHDTLVTGPGTFNIIRGGTDETLIAKGKTDVVVGGRDDNIVGGPGYDSLYGGPGNIMITAGTGRGEARAGSGNDRLIAGPTSRSALIGGRGNDTFYIHGTKRIGVFAGTGNDTFHVFGKNATKSIIVLARHGHDTLYTDHSLTVPQNIATAIATAPRVTLTGVPTTEKLVGERSGDALIAGPGDERLIAGAGRNVIVFSRFGFDVATGGRGADDFIFMGVPFSTWRGQTPRRVYSHRITDFNPRKGDRVVLRAKYFGDGLLSNGLTLQERHHPAATTRNPTLLFDPASKLLSYDPDGTGPQRARLIVRLSDFACERSGSKGVGRYHVRVELGAHCLPEDALLITR